MHAGPCTCSLGGLASPLQIYLVGIGLGGSGAPRPVLQTQAEGGQSCLGAPLPPAKAQQEDCIGL